MYICGVTKTKEMENQFVPYELAVKLKGLGFDEECFGYYNSKGTLRYQGQVEPLGGMDVQEMSNEVVNSKYCSSPLWQQSFDWFRGNHNLYIIIIPTINMYWTFKTMTVIEGMVEVPPYDHVDANDYSTYEEARVACLEKLIEIVENKNKRNGNIL